jgi:hypothetical protein
MPETGKDELRTYAQGRHCFVGFGLHRFSVGGFWLRWIATLLPCREASQQRVNMSVAAIEQRARHTGA